MKRNTEHMKSKLFFAFALLLCSCICCIWWLATFSKGIRNVATQWQKKMVKRKRKKQLSSQSCSWQSCRWASDSFCEGSCSISAGTDEWRNFSWRRSNMKHWCHLTLLQKYLPFSDVLWVLFISSSHLTFVSYANDTNVWSYIPYYRDLEWSNIISCIRLAISEK